MRPVILCLDPGVLIPELGSYNIMQQMSPLPISYHLPALAGMDSVLWEEKTQGIVIAGMVILGSRASVKDSLAWQKPFYTWLEAKLALGIPTMGVCFGHQLLAYLHGAPIQTMAKKLQGERLVTLVSGGGLYTPGKSYRIIMSHQDYVADLPRQATLLGTSELCPIDALAYGDHIWSFQPHIDATPLFTRVMPQVHIPETFPYDQGHGLMNMFLEACKRFADKPTG